MRRGTIALVGRPNVGKSTLFNRIVGGRRAIVDDRPGVTRDRHFSRGEWAGHHFWLVDTGGWVSGQDDAISRGIRDQINTAVTEADVIVLVVDTKEGVHPADLEVAQLLRPLVDRVVVAANKADELPDEVDHFAFHELGLGDPHPVSASTGKGSGDLLDRVVEKLGDGTQPSEPDGPSVAVIGRPNAGKSSLMNRLLGADRAIVAPEAGTTRDAIDSPLRYHGQTLNFIDTAGLRRRPKVKDDLEFYSALRAERAIERADICVLVVDATIGVHAQDLRVASQAWEAGKGVIVAVNKWDLVSEKDTDTAERGKKKLVDRAPFLGHAPFLFVSALTGQRVRRVFDTILEVAEARDRRIPTAEVNRVLQALVDRNQPPQQVGKEVKLLYATQIGTAPPTFALVTNRPEAVPESYVRYLVNGFYDSWGMVGNPIRIKLRRKRSSSR
jgi:GTP-binding protein